MMSREGISPSYGEKSIKNGLLWLIIPVNFQSITPDLRPLLRINFKSRNVELETISLPLPG